MTVSPARGQVRRALEGNVEKVARLLEEGAKLDDIVEELGLRDLPGNVKGGLSAAIAGVGHSAGRYPELADALKKRVEAQVKRNQGESRNTSVNEVSDSTGLGFPTIKGFVRRTGINLNPLGDVNAARTATIRERYGRGDSKKNIAKDLGIDPETVGMLMENAGIEERVVQPTPSRRKEFQTALLKTLLTTLPAEGEAVVGNEKLMELHPECGTTPMARRKALKQTKGVLSDRMTAILQEMRTDDMSRRRDLWTQLKDLKSELFTREVLAQRRTILTELEGMGKQPESALIGRVRDRINQEFFKGADGCPESFALRLARLNVYGDTKEVFNPQIPTPQTLDEVVMQLQRYSDTAPGRAKNRLVWEMSTSDLMDGAPSFYALIKKKLRQKDPKTKDVDIAKTIVWILTGQQWQSYYTDWSKKTERKAAVDSWLAEADGDPLKVTTRVIGGGDIGLHKYFRENRASKNLRESLAMALEESADLTPKQRAFLLSRKNRDEQKRLVLKHFDFNRHQRHYEGVLGMGKMGTGNVMRELADELTQAVDAGETPRIIADRYGVGARGINNLIQACTQRERGIIRLTTRSETDVNEGLMVAREDMLSIEDLSETLGKHLDRLRGVSEGKRKPAGSVSRSTVLNPLEEHLGGLIEACDSRDYESMARLADTVMKEVINVRSIPQTNRSITVRRRRGGDFTAFMPDSHLNEIERTTRTLKEESEFR